MERETKQITTPSGHVCTLYSYITAREQREIDNISLSAIDVVQDATGAIKQQKIDPTTIRQTEDALLKALVVELDGSTEDIIDRLLDLRSIDYAEILKVADAIATGKDFEERKKK